MSLSCKDYEWSNDSALSLIDQYERFPILWDSKHKDHFSKSKKNDAWEAISIAMDLDVVTIRQKLNSLLGSFRREKAKGKKGVGAGKARKPVYVSKWFAFKSMQFLLDKDERRSTVKSENEEQEQTDTDETCSEAPIYEADLFIEEPVKIDKSQVSTTAVSKQIKRKISDRKDDERLEGPFNIIKYASEKKVTEDPCDIYGKHIANKLRAYNMRTRAQVEHAINNILYNADMGKYETN